MPVIPSAFRVNFPEFASTVTYPDATVTYWLGIGAAMVISERWAELTDHGIQLFAAHHLVLAARSVNAVQGGGAPGLASGVVTSKAVDKVSVSYDAGSVSLTDAGHWNGTTYGVQFFQMNALMGAGGMQF